ncbi:hypothetical protein JQ596_33900 [Bradyrhizobium manausense]|uniref:TackOD1 domain-containing metal-binding protein n=1 Tax=Bradyrhizobium TaxID=374 RepID=UPI001BA617B8|nr:MULTISPECIES: hypothetical protein [Bradyrhizobium]MBR0830513.1 hypothetical protein [Bradyrhizobium manausense]UVO28255.1 hypothetical protein KUF59_38290 [Bradyrhizobium arachidis]
MQISANQSNCPVCQNRLAFDQILHHMVCAYVGPSGDFGETDDGYVCPKCRRGIVSSDPACEIVGTSARCSACGKEMIVSPAASTMRR